MRKRKEVTERDLILTAAGTLAGLTHYLYSAHNITGGGEPIAIANALIRSGSFRDPFIVSGPTGPSAHLAPLLPWILAGFKLLPWQLATVAMVGCVCLASGIQAALLPRISEVLFQRTRPGMIAALCAMVLPIFTPDPVWENLYSAAAVLGFCVLARKPAGTADGVRCGAAAGLLLLLNPSLAVIIGCWLGYRFWEEWPGLRAVCRFSAVFCLVCGAVLLPWEIRNYRELGGFIFVRDNMGLELYAANNDCAGPTLFENLASGCEKLVHPILNREEAADMRRMGELNYNHDRQRRALAWIALHPERFRRLAARRVLDFWFPPDTFWITPVTWLSLAGLGLAFRCYRKAAWFAVAVLALYPLPYYVVQFSTRFRYPVMWISLLLAGYALDRVWQAAAARMERQDALT